MTEPKVSTFSDRLIRLRAGDQVEIEQFVAEYQPIVLRALSFRMSHSSLGPVFESADICQFALFDFLSRLFTGEYSLQNDADLQKLLLSIAHKKFLKFYRHEMAAKRCRALTKSLNDLPELAMISLERSEVNQYAYRHNTTELRQTLATRFSKAEMELYLMRCQGKSWATISEQLREAQSTLRKRLSRAIRRVAMELRDD